MIDFTPALPPLLGKSTDHRPNPQVRRHVPNCDELSWLPFPTQYLPEPLRTFTERGALAIGCDEAFVALPLLTMLAAAVGNRFRLEVKPQWEAVAVLWTMLIGDSGSAKTPALRLALQVMEDWQGRAWERFEQKMAAYRAEQATCSQQHDAKKRKAGTDPQGTGPTREPTAERILVSDTTVEALAVLLADNPRGLLLARDELNGWLGSFDRYGNRRSGSDLANWLSMHCAQPLTVDRKTGNHRALYVPRAAVSVCGGIQPEILRRAWSSELREAGLAARMLVAWPPRRAKCWSEQAIDQATYRSVADVIERLLGRETLPMHEGRWEPCRLEMDRPAKAAWIAYYDNHNRELAELTGDLASAWSKLEECAARLALVLHCARWAAADNGISQVGMVDEQSLQAAIGLVEWFKHETRRVYALLQETAAESDRRRLEQWLAIQVRPVTTREVMRACRQLKTAEEAETALAELAAAGRGKWIARPSGPTGGQPTREFLYGTQDTTPATPEGN